MSPGKRRLVSTSNQKSHVSIGFSSLFSKIRFLTWEICFIFYSIINMAHDTVGTCACTPTEDRPLDPQKADDPYHHEPGLGLAALSRVGQITSNNSYFLLNLLSPF